ncbi:MAG: sugar ABC transporter ATP-binding protein [Rectinemataceae bacterium]
MNDTVLELRGINKSFPGVAALKDVDLRVERNEILGLVGENGAGKSTLMKIMIGFYRADEGSYLLHGDEVAMAGPDDAIRAGIGMVFQEGCMIPNLSVMDNLFLANERTFSRGPFLDRKAMAATAREELAIVGLGSLDPRTIVGSLPAARKQMIEIARLLWLSTLYEAENPILILDEPTTVLQESETEILFGILGELKKRASIVFISHRLEEVVRLSDRIVVLKDGAVVSNLERGNADVHKIEMQMVGHELAAEHYRESMQTEARGKVVLSVHDLSMAGKFEGFSLDLREGEIVGLVGLLGSGKEEVCRCLGGSEAPSSGTISVHGREIRFSSPKDAIAAGVGVIPIDRRNEGLATTLDVASNINLLVLSRMRRGPFLSPALEKKSALKWIVECMIKTPSPQSSCSTLSGGNQQKVVIAKWLAAEAGILVLDHPTRGIDVGAKDEIYRRIRELAAAGLSIIIMCDTLEEDIGLSDRIVIMKDGRTVREISCAKGAKPTPVDVIGYVV